MIYGPCAAPTPLIPPRVLDALADTLAAEKSLLDTLGVVMCRQRAAVGINDVQAISDAVFAMHRLLLSLGEARERRRTIHQLLGYDEEPGIDQLDALLGEAMTPRLRAERDALQRTVRGLSIEIDVNRQLLQETRQEWMPTSTD